MKAAGMRLVVMVVKHHDGYCLWQTRYTTHSVAGSPWRDGKGDVLRDLSRSCQKYGLQLGVYLSPADLYQIENAEGLYGNLSKYTERTIPRPVEGRPFVAKRTFCFKVDDYNEYFLNQLFELLTEYGPVHDVWFDGAHPKRKGGQTYTYQSWYELIRALVPDAVVFGKGPEVRWCGNEGGHTRDAEWNVIPLPVHPDECTWPDLRAGDLGSREKLYGAKYLYYMPPEVNTSIRHGWFYRDDAQQSVRSAEDVFDGNPKTFWHTSWQGGDEKAPKHPHHLAVDLGAEVPVSGFTYLPRQDRRVPDSMVEAWRFEVSTDGQNWTPVKEGEFGNLVNDPTQRIERFDQPRRARYIRFVSLRGAQGKPYAGAAEIRVLSE